MSILVVFLSSFFCISFFFFNNSATTEFYTLSLHDALPILCSDPAAFPTPRPDHNAPTSGVHVWVLDWDCWITSLSKTRLRDRKSTRLNSSHVAISYAVFCLKKKKHNRTRETLRLI